MAKFKYVAQDNSGKTVKGTLEAEDAGELQIQLREMKLLLISSKEIEVKVKNKRLSVKALADFSRQLGTMIGAGIPLVRTMQILIRDDTIKANEKVVYTELLKLVRQGNSLSRAMEIQSNVFPPMMVSMFAAAEATGDMDRTALRMANHYEKEYKLKSKVSSATTYPKILGVIIVLVVLVLVKFVLPQFESLFESMELPTTTKILFWICDAVENYWYIIIGLVVLLVAVFKAVFSTPSVKLATDKLKLKLPVIGKLLRVICTARFARTLSSLYTSGVPIVTALQVAKKTIGNSYIESQFDEMIMTVRAGTSLSDGLGTVDGFTEKFKMTIQVGEESGSLDSMLDSIAASLEYDSEIALNKLLTYLEPLMIVLMAVIVGFIIISIITPLFGSYDTIGQGYQI